MIILHKEKYTSIEISIVIFVLINSSFSTLILNMFKGYSIFEIIISLIGSFLLGFFFINCIVNNYKNDFISFVFNNKVTKYFISLLLIICSFVILIYSTYYLSNIVKDVLLPDQSIILIYVSILLVSYYLSSKGLKASIVAANLLFIIYFFIFFIIIFFNITNISSLNIMTFNFIIKNNNIFNIFITLNSPILLLFLIKKKEIDNFYLYKNNFKKTYFFSYIFISFRIFFILSILGINYMNILKYPEIAIFKSIDIFNFLKRLEEIFLINIFIFYISIITLCFCYIKKFLDSFEIEKKWHIFFFILALILLINLKIIDNNYLMISNIVFIITNLIILIKKERFN